MKVQKESPQTADTFSVSITSFLAAPRDLSACVALDFDAHATVVK